MAIYKIFPEKSATLYSYYPTLNAGNDEILDLSTYYVINGTRQVSRPLIKFSQSEIIDVITNKVSGSFNASLKLSLANASQIPLDYTIYCYPIATSWNRGTGRLSNTPITTDGVSWEFKDQLSGSTWFTIGNLPANTTASYSGSVGGGLWYTSSNYPSSQSFTNISSKDIELNVTNIVAAWSGSIITNNGFILKNSDLLEFSTSSAFELKYFSANTHTIYPPCLEFKWNDWIYNTGSLTVATSPSIIATLANNQSEFHQESIQRFRINVRDQFPTRAFSPTSVYLVNKALPTASYYQIKDLDSEEIVVDYDTIYTKISCDSTGMYFDVYMSGLEPERYYKILIQTTINGTTLVLDNNNYFKVVR